MSTEALWLAVDAITKATTKRVFRDPDPEWLDELRTRPDGFCDVTSYRSATVTYASIPSLWDRASDALGVGLEGGSRSVLSARSPVDMDLMEIRSIIRETVIHELAERLVRIGKKDTVPILLRRLATYVIPREPDRLWWWEYRFAQWARLLETYLRAVDEQPKSIRLINTACVECGTRQVNIEAEDGIQVVPALLIEFREGAFRAVVCGACSHTIWRGDDVETFAAEIAKQPRLLRSGRQDGRITA